MTRAPVTLEDWSRDVSCEASYLHYSLDDEHLVRIGRLRRLLRMPLPAEWLRTKDDDALWAVRPYRRSDHANPRTGEHELEKRILDNLSKVQFLDGQLVDGVNAFPLAVGKKIEADLLLLGRQSKRFEIYVVEAKWADRAPWGANDPWYAVVENLKQLVLLRQSPRAQAFFSRRAVVPGVPTTPSLVGIVLAPPAYYTAAGKRSKAVAPAMELIRQVREDGLDVRLCCFDLEAKRVSELKP